MSNNKVLFRVDDRFYTEADMQKGIFLVEEYLKNTRQGYNEKIPNSALDDIFEMYVRDKIPLSSYIFSKEYFKYIQRKSRANIKCLECEKNKNGTQFGYRARICFSCANIARTQKKSHRRYISKRLSHIKITKDGSINEKSLTNMLSQQGYLCASCGKDIIEDRHLDHIIPIAKGGEHKINNVQWLCPQCNSTKNQRQVTNKQLRSIVNAKRKKG